ncbi:MAG: hypothetical protein LQ348_003381 [Seirophora lacunosa]|nr:MAG: hypothetical protein LQ348_003381 [Seirophora lacunosa]
MSDQHWTVIEHVIPASHIRGFTRGVRYGSSGRLRLAVKQYVPKCQGPGSSKGMTIVMAHGVGSSKESYEPFFDGLLHCGLPIRAVWAMDIAHHGASYLLNEDVIGDDHHWFDSSRDIFQMINHFQEQMPAPIIGIGQSWGTVSVCMLAIWHPTLFSGLIVIEPLFGQAYRSDTADDTTKAQTRRTAQLLVNRKDTWPSREAAREHFLSNPYYRSFDPRVFERVMRYDLRDLPSKNDFPAAVTLTTPKTMETYSIIRADPPLAGFPETPDYRTRTARDIIVPGFYHGERSQYLDSLQYLSPPMLYVWGSLSGYASTGSAIDMLHLAGTGLGGNGGVASDKVNQVVVEGAHHPVPLEKPAAAAQAIAPWLEQHFAAWEAELEHRRHEPPLAIKDFPSEYKERIAKLNVKTKL